MLTVLRTLCTGSKMYREHFLPFFNRAWLISERNSIILSIKRFEFNFLNDNRLSAPWDVNCDLLILNSHALKTRCLLRVLPRPWRSRPLPINKIKLIPIIPFEQTCKPSELGQNVGDWLKELTRIDFYETSEVNVPMVCQKIIAKDGNIPITAIECRP